MNLRVSRMGNTEPPAHTPPNQPLAHTGGGNHPGCDSVPNTGPGHTKVLTSMIHPTVPNHGQTG